MGKYIDDFLALKCSSDVLSVVSPLGHKAEKEISETMAVIKHLKPIALSNKMQIALWDLCAGNALTSVLAAHLLPFTYTRAVDKQHRKRDWEKVRNFEYREGNIFLYNPIPLLYPSVICAVHPCDNLAIRVVDIYNKTKTAKHLVLMPCCHGHIKSSITIGEHLSSTITKYMKWCLALAERCVGKVSIDIDEKCLSPKNIIIVAHKG